jgi:glycosyltransferase involved in cell wall biosynthesis
MRVEGEAVAGGGHASDAAGKTNPNGKLVGVIGGSIGHDPFNRRAWSGICYFLFTEMQRQGRLHRAFGAEVGGTKRLWLLAKNLHPSRAVWRQSYYMDVGYRSALTREITGRLTDEDYQHTLFQIGAMFNMAQGVKDAGRSSRCLSYHDGNLALALRSPVFPKGIPARVVDRALQYEKSVYQSMHCVLTMSEYLRQSFLHDFDVPPERVVTIGGGINQESLPPPAPNKAYDRPEILFVGVEFARKGGWNLLAAFKAVVQRFPQAQLHLVGPRELTIPPDQQKGVTYHGYLSKAEAAGAQKLAQLYARCSLFVMPSLYEPFGIAPLEAMSHGIPCIVTGDWALREMVEPGVTGEWVGAGSVEDLVEQIGSCLSDPGRLQRMGVAGRERVLQRYTWEKVVQRLASACLSPSGTTK